MTELLAFFSIFICGLLLGSLWTSRRWKKHCKRNDERWMKYHRALIDIDLKKMEEEQTK